MGKGRAKGHYGKLQRGYQGGQGVPWQPSRGQMGTGKAREMVTINPAMLSSLSSTTSSPSSIVEYAVESSKDDVFMNLVFSVDDMTHKVCLYCIRTLKKKRLNGIDNDE